MTDGASTVANLSYAYGDGVNLTAITGNVAPASSVALAYTAANRLGSATGPWGATSYSYDGVGNRLSETTTPPGGSAVTRVTSLGLASNRLSSVAVGGATVRSFSHDAAGNLTVDQKGADTFTTTYNVRNRPASVTRTGPTPETSSYAWNALEQLVSRSTTAAGGPLGTVHYIYDPQGHLIAEADAATGQTLREYIWLAANDNAPVDLPLAVITGVNTSTPATVMVHADHLGRPIRMTDASRATVWQASYTPFGEPSALSGTIEQNLRFPGQYFLIEQGLAANWHRFYDPSTGRYTQPDPLRFVDGPSVYAYVGGSPVMQVDPEGLLILPPDPSGLPPDWKQDPEHRNPKGTRWKNPQGGCLDFEPGTTGEPGWRGKPHWHDCSDPNDKKRQEKHRKPGENCPQPGDVAPSPPEPLPYIGPPIFLPLPTPGGGGGGIKSPFPTLGPFGLPELLG